MEMKSYQKAVIADLSRYLQWMEESGNYKEAFRLFWKEQGVPALGRYQDILPGVPDLCFKVPTGGGKTFLACNAIRPIFAALPPSKLKAVVWLVPSDAILTQTLKALKDPAHPYRQKLDGDFGGRVEVYSKQELLQGQNFNESTVQEQLSVMVLSYDSFRGRSKEGLKAYQENSNLAGLAKMLGMPVQPIKNADETALFQIINQLCPLVIVDESHHARSELSREMLKNFNPCFVLDLTATPRKESNIISYVDALALKKENMVKLPVVVYNRTGKNEVLADAIDLRAQLETLAKKEEAETGRYVRPIVLFQAQPKGKEGAATFQKLKEKLLEAGIPEQEIAIRTADINELKNQDLLSPACPVRYIITINALKEGWDCSFAYILASLANKTSQVDVEQILGRILRLPCASAARAPALNLSYVLTASADFHDTVAQIIKGLNYAGFSAKDYRTAGEEKSVPQPAPPVQPTLAPSTPDSEAKDDDFADLDGRAVRDELARRQEEKSDGGDASRAEDMLRTAEEAGEAYGREAKKVNETRMEPMAREVEEKMNHIPVKPQFHQDIEALCIPQFFLHVPQSLFVESGTKLLERQDLLKDFDLRDKDSHIDFDMTDDELMEVDVRDGDSGVPRAFLMDNADQRAFKAFFNSLPEEGQIRKCQDILFDILNRDDTLQAGSLRDYIGRITVQMTAEERNVLRKAPRRCAEKIREKIKSLQDIYMRNVFHEWRMTGRIVCEPSYQLPEEIHPAESTAVYGGSLYEAEETGNELEQGMMQRLSGMENVRWWHRNIARQGFCLNGYISHYPDFIICMTSGRILLVETKGGYLMNADSQNKWELGQRWSAAAGEDRWKYFMVFDDGASGLDRACTMSTFCHMLKEL